MDIGKKTLLLGSAALLMGCEQETKFERGLNKIYTGLDEIMPNAEKEFEDVRQYEVGELAGVPYSRWEKPGTLESGFTIGDSTDYVSFEEQPHVVNSFGRSSPIRDVRAQGSIPEFSDEHLSDMNRLLKFHQYNNPDLLTEQDSRKLEAFADSINTYMSQ